MVCTAAPAVAAQLGAAAKDAGVGLTEIGEVAEGQGVRADFEGEAIAFAKTGWRHG